MPKVSEVFGGAYLKAEQLNGQPRIITIDGVNTETVYGEDAYVVYIAGERRGLRLSATCARDIAAALGLDRMEEWSGHSVELYPEQRTITDRETQIEKSITMIRARAPAGSSAKPPAPPSGTPPRSTPSRRPPIDDDIPF